MTKATAGRYRWALVLLLLLALLTAACGTRRNLSDIEAAARGGITAGIPTQNGSTGTAPGASAQNRTGSASGITSVGGTLQTRQLGEGGGQTAIGPRQSATLPPIKIGSVGTISGIGGTQVGGVQAIQAWARNLNGSGGIDGHPVQVIVVDDGADPARHRAALQELVEKQHVVAFVGNLSVFSISAAAVKYVEQKRVPVVGGDRLSQFWYTSRMMFPQASAGDGLIWIHMANTRRLAGRGAPVGWLTCQEAQICRDADRLWNVYAPELGLNKKFSDSVSVFQPDFTAQCLRAKNAGVKWLLLGTDANSIRRIGASCEQQDYHPRYAVLQTSDEMGQERGLDGGYYAASTFPWVATDSPARREFHTVMSRYAPDAVLSAHATSGWAAAKLFEKVARGIGAPFTSTRLLEGLWSIRNDTLEGLTPAITFRRNSTAVPEYCYFPVELRNGRWITTDGGRLFCTSPPK